MTSTRRLALGRLVSLTGGSAAYVALIAAIYERTGSAVWLSSALFAGVVTTVAAAPAAGWVGDRFDRRRVMIAADIAAAAVSVGLAAAGRPEALVLLFGLSSAVQAPFEPASAAAIPSLVGREGLVRANALVAMSGSAGYLLGPLLGGAALAAGASPAGVFAVDAATFLVSAVLVASIRRPFGRGATDEHPGMLAGFRVIVRHRTLRAIVGAGMASLVGVGIVNVAAYPLSLALGGGTAGFGTMTALLGGAGVVGAAVAGRTTALAPRQLLVGAFAAGAVGLAIAGAVPVLAIVLCGLALAGIGQGVGDVAATTLLQSRTADAVRSRVFAAQDGAAHSAFTLAALVGGLLVEGIGARGALGVAAACSAVAVVFARRADPA